VAKIKDISGFHGSLELLRQEELAHSGLSADGQAVIADLEHMFKALPPVTPEVEAKLAAQRYARGLAGRTMKPSAFFAKALTDLGTMVKAIPATAGKVAGIKVAAPAPTEADLVAKAHNHLLFNEGLNAEQRGNLLLGISAAHDRRFAKAEQHPVAAQVEQIKTALEQARATRDLGPAEPFLVEALTTIERGIRDSDDRDRLMGLLMQLRQALAAGDEGAL